MSTRTFRLAPSDQSGWVLGLGPAQVLPLAGGLLVALLVLSRTESLMLALVPGTAGAVAGFLRIADAPLLEAAPTILELRSPA